MALSKIRSDSLEDTAVHGVRNLIMNGAMQVAQRGTSATVTTASSPLTIDRFSTTIANLDQASLTESQDSTVPSGQGFAKSFKVVVGGTAETTLDADEQVYIRYQGIEGQDAQHLAFGTSSTKKTTLSFWVRSGVTGNYAVLMYTNNGIGGASPRSQTLTYTVNSVDTWEYKTITFDGDGASGNALADDTSAELQLYFSLAAGSNSTATDGTSWGAYAQGKFAYGQTANLVGTANAAFYITGIQLEVGDTATPFEHRRFDDEWHSCQRYCTVYNVGGGNTHPQNLVSTNHTVPGAAGHVDVGNRAEWFMSYPVKRAQPTITVTDPTNMRWLANGNVVVDGNGSVTFPVGASYQNANVFQGVPSSISTSSVPEGWLYKGSGTNPVITIDAEL